MRSSEEKEEREFLHAHLRDCEDDKQLLVDEDNASEAVDTNAPPSSSSSSFVIPELRLDRSFSADALSTPGTDEEYEEDEEDDEEEEEDSDDNYLERSDSKRRSMVEASSCEKHPGGLSVQNSLRRRTHSEGSLLQDPRTSCFTSDNAINCMEGSGTNKGGWTLPSPKTLKKELTKNGGSMHQLCMLFSGRKCVQCIVFVLPHISTLFSTLLEQLQESVVDVKSVQPSVVRRRVIYCRVFYPRCGCHSRAGARMAVLTVQIQ
ncbi:Regulator of G-protein signaling 3 [Anabarilius grahami]|uniref:Regulator of G-protein signaling 3 n=1 Tax=Anabarilius grahami TaxID=495550 RepID=A0A3N0XWV0_ANAGA|nr:Regulator of G-protein signaling 3 [Anabarilius grahami]